MAGPLWWRRVRQNFGISAPHMSVHTRLPWWGRVMLLLALALVIGGMWWLGFDFGQLFGGHNRHETEARIASLEAESARLHSETTELRARSSQLDSELAMTQGAQDALTRQITDLTGENTQLKEELAFLQRLFADSNKQPGLAIQRLSAERENEEIWRYSLLVVRGGAPAEDFQGRVTLEAMVGMPDGPSRLLTLPADQPDAEALLKLKFKYYQRVEGMLRVPAGARITALTARIYDAAGTSPQASRTLTMP